MIDQTILVALKTALSVLTAGGTLILAQLQMPNLDAIGSVGLVGFLALMVGRYTFHQLESYRSDLSTARERIDALEEDLHALGKAKAKVEHRNRELEHYSSQLQLYIAQSFGGTPADMPRPPEPSA